jgi:hypothetical protein
MLWISFSLSNRYYFRFIAVTSQAERELGYMIAAIFIGPKISTLKEESAVVHR